MADRKLTALTAVSDLADTDLLYVVDGVGGTPTSKKITGTNLKDAVLSDLWVNASHYDDFASAFAAAKATSRPLYVPEGTWTLSGALTVDVVGMRIFGAGRDLTTIVLDDAAARITVASARCDLQDFTIDADSVAEHGLVFAGGRFSSVRRVTVRGATSHGVLVADSGNNRSFVVHERCQYSANGGDGYHMADAPASAGHEFVQCEATTNTASGLHLRSSAHVVWGGNYSDNGEFGIRFSAPATTAFTRGCMIVHPYMDGGSNTSGDISVAGHGADDPLVVIGRNLQQNVVDDPGEFRHRKLSPSSLAGPPLAAVVAESAGVVAWDDFGRDDGVLGSTRSGESWTVESGAFEVVDGTAKRPTGTNAESIATFDAGQVSYALDVTLTHPDTSGVNAGVVFRFVDTDNFLRVRSYGVGIRLVKRVSGSDTTLQTWVPADQRNSKNRLWVTVDGADISCVDLRSGETLGSHTLAGGDETTFGSSTKVGLLEESTLSTGVRNTVFGPFVVRGV